MFYHSPIAEISTAGSEEPLGTELQNVLWDSDETSIFCTTGRPSSHSPVRGKIEILNNQDEVVGGTEWQAPGAVDSAFWVENSTVLRARVAGLPADTNHRVRFRYEDTGS